jgi:hypothetical protein
MTRLREAEARSIELDLQRRTLENERMDRELAVFLDTLRRVVNSQGL